MKKKLRIVLFLSLLVCLLCAAVHAEEPEAAEQPLIIVEEDRSYPRSSAPAEPQGISVQALTQSSPETLAQAKQALLEGMQNFKEEIDIRSCGISSDELGDLYVGLAYEHPELFYVKTQWGWSIAYEGSTKVLSVFPSYSIDGKVIPKGKITEYMPQIQQQQAELTQKVEEITAQIGENWTPLQKALYLHDYIATHGQYDTISRVDDKNKIDERRRDAYGMLIDGIGVCQGYTLAYRLLLKEVGIDSGTVTSDSMNHVWNLIRIDGNWYHVDVTWDDPTEDRIGQSQHVYFCLSEDKLKDTNKGAHNAPDFKYSLNVKTDDKTFDNYYWANVDSAFVPLNGKWYYLLYQSGLMQTADPKQEGSLKKQINTDWYVWMNESSYWLGLYSGLSRYNDELIYNTTDTVYRYDPKSETEQKVYSLTAAERSEGYIYGTVVVGNELRYLVQQSPYAEEPAAPRVYRLDPYTTVTAGGYAYYLEGKTLYLKPSGTQSGSVIAAWYTEDGKLLGMEFLNGEELTANVSGAKTVKIFAAANTDYHPLCEATVCTIG